MLDSIKSISWCFKLVKAIGCKWGSYVKAKTTIHHDPSITKHCVLHSLTLRIFQIHFTSTVVFYMFSAIWPETQQQYNVTNHFKDCINQYTVCTVSSWTIAFFVQGTVYKFAAENKAAALGLRPSPPQSRRYLLLVNTWIWKTTIFHRPGNLAK